MVLTFCRYEWIELAMLNRSIFASRWMQALHLACGDSFSADSSFALLYVMHNPVCRRDISRKTRMATKLLAEALYPIHKQYLGKSKSFWFYVQSAWVVLKFSIKNQSLADCNPTIVLIALKQPDTALFKHINRILMLVNNHERDAKAKWNIAKTKIFSNLKLSKRFLKQTNGLQSEADSPLYGHPDNVVIPMPQPAAAPVSWLQRMKNCWKRSNRVVPVDPDHEQRSDDAPKLFIDSFELKRVYVDKNIAEDSRLSLLTMLLFPEADDFGATPDCLRYKREFEANLHAFQKAFRSLFLLSKDLEFADSSEKIAHLSCTKRLFLRVFDTIFGEDMKLLRNFHWLSDKETSALLQHRDFPQLNVDDFYAPSVDTVLKQLLATDQEKSHHDSQNTSQEHALDSSTPGALSLESDINETPAAPRVIPAYANHGRPRVAALLAAAFGSDEKQFGKVADSIDGVVDSKGASKDQVARFQTATFVEHEVRTLKNENMTLRKNLRSATAESTSAKAELTSAKAELTSAKAELTSAKAELTSAKAESTAASQRAISAEMEVRSLQAQVKDLLAAQEIYLGKP
jgi:hypothetical protein